MDALEAEALRELHDQHVEEAVATHLDGADDDEYCCWVCDAIATPIYDDAGNIIGSNCRACSHAGR